MGLDQALEDHLVGLALTAAAHRMPDTRRNFGLLVGGAHDRLETDHRRIAAAMELAVVIPDIGHATGHAGRKVATGTTKHHNGAAGHVFAAMVAGAFDHRHRARVAHRKPLTGHAVEVGLALGGAVEHGIADDDVLGAVATEIVGTANDHAAARQSFADIVIGLADQIEGDAAGQEGRKALAGRTVELRMDGVVGQTGMGIAACDLAREHRAHGAVDVADRQDEADRLALFERLGRLLDQLVIERPIKTVVLRADRIARHIGRHGRRMENARKVEAARFPVSDAGTGIEQVGCADQVVEAADAELRHQGTRLFGHEEEVVDDVLGLAGEFLAQHRILRGHAHRTGVEVAFAHHDAAFDHQRRGGESELIGAQNCTDHHIAAGLHLAVGLQAHAPAQTVEHQGLLGLGQTQLPGRSGVLDRGPGRCAGAAVVTGDGDVIGLRFGHTRGHRADTHFRHQLDRDRCPRIAVFEIVDQLGKVFDGVDVVMRRRRDQADAGHRKTQPGNVVGHLVAGQLPALAGLGALGHLDLDLVGTDQVFGGDTEAAGGDLLDARAQGIAGHQRDILLDRLGPEDTGHGVAGLDRDAAQFIAIAAFVFAALTGV